MWLSKQVDYVGQKSVYGFGNLCDVNDADEGPDSVGCRSKISAPPIGSAHGFGGVDEHGCAKIECPCVGM
ncbi:hypothetical protein A5734_16815 [Mycolicibacterium fortuitum]|nr:hypothetical protein A5734_16815 [Mycolicibacterium fortuitum]